MSRLSVAALPLTLGLVLGLSALLTAAEAPAKLELKKGDHIAIIGNTLAERMQHANNFETLLHSQFPDLQLVVRNQGWSADEPSLRPRSSNFGSPDKHLEAVKADVVLAFFGFNESFAGEQGLQKFKDELKKFITHAQGQKYNGTSAPRLVIVSPIAHEDLGDKNLPDGKKSNENLKLYTAAMAEVCSETGVQFVNLFDPTQKLMTGAAKKWTINGVHLNENGDEQLAPVLFAGLLGKEAKYDAASLAKLKAEVAEKNYQYFMRHRAVNGFYIYGGRSNLWNNNNVMERERAILDEMTANRDARIWAVAAGQPVAEKIDDSNTQPFLEVKSNYNKDPKYLSPEEALKTFKLPEGYEINCFASEVDFPELANPCQMATDAKGRVWVTTMPSYPQYLPKKPVDDMVLILEDTNGDGKADKKTIFARGLHVPTGIELGFGGAFVAQQPDLLFLKDTDGDGVADQRETVLHGFDSADSHHSISAFTWDNSGALYFEEGTFHHSQIETPWGPERLKDAGVFRYEPRTQKFDVFVSYGFANPWGHTFDRWGQNFVADASGGANYFGTAFSGHVDYPRKHSSLKQFLTKQYRPTSGCEFVSSRNFPDDVQGNYLLNNCIGFQGVAQYKMKEDGSGFAAEPAEVLLKSSDQNFRPVDLEFGADGALYVVDWNNALIGHMQHSIRDPKRDTSHGRVWRITYKGRPLVTPAKIAGEPIPQLLSLLGSEYEERTRYRIRRELGERNSDEVMAEVKKWVDSLDKSAPNYENCMLEALWLHQHHNVVDEALLKRVLTSPEPKARAAATRVLCYWRDQVKDPLALLQVQVNDEHPRVRLEAVRACSFFTGKDGAKAYEIALESLAHPQDDYLKYTLKETSATLDKYWKAGE